MWKPGLLAACILTLVACNSEDAQNLGQDAKNLASHTGQALGGMTLAAKVHMKLALTKGIEMSGLHIDAKEGVVTVSGHVGTPEEKRKVLQVVNDTVGVDRVVDELRVQP